MDLHIFVTMKPCLLTLYSYSHLFLLYFSFENEIFYYYFSKASAMNERVLLENCEEKSSKRIKTKLKQTSENIFKASYKDESLITEPKKN